MTKFIEDRDTGDEDPPIVWIDGWRPASWADLAQRGCVPTPDRVWQCQEWFGVVPTRY